MLHSKSALCKLALAASSILFAACAPVRTRPAAEARLASDEATLSSLDTKLSATWARYAAARSFAIDKVVKQNGLVQRAEWEEKLAAPTGAGLTQAEISALRGRHDEAVSRAQALARQESRLDLNKLRGSGSEAKFCGELPKGGMLHIHPWGTLDRRTVREILQNVNPLINFTALATSLNNPGGTGAIYPEEHAALADAKARAGDDKRFNDLDEAARGVIEGLFFLPPGNHSFDRFTGTFTAISALVFGGTFDAEPLMMQRFFERAKAHNIRYVEISRFIVPKPQWIASLDAWAADVKATYGITARYLAAYARNKEPEFTRKKAEQLLKLPASKILTGINFVADETSYPALEFGQTMYLPVTSAFAEGKSALKRTIHAGELGDPRNVRDALILGADRIGHGVNFASDVVTVEYARANKIPIEINLNSNQRLKVAEDLKAHPFLRYLRLGIPVSFSTDDEGIFESTIDDECLLAIANSDIEYAELKQTSYNAIDAAFLEESVKGELKSALDQDFADFEGRWQEQL